MLNSTGRSRKLRILSRFSDDHVRSPKALGCTSCLDLAICGGLHVRSGAFNCLAYCCGNPVDCDSVCMRSPEFVSRVREVGGFGLGNVPRARDLVSPVLPLTIPMVYSRSRRAEPLSARAVGLSLFQVIHRAIAEPKFCTREAMCAYFAISPGSDIVLSGTAFDAPLERWWALGRQRGRLAERLVDLGITAATTPNFSLFSDVPRWDDLHSMKRIAIVWQEMTQAGLRTALHVNARTARDWDRWTDFVGDRDQIKSVAYEFGTGAGTPGRIGWHVDGLCELAETVERPLNLIVRGGLPMLRQLASSFGRVSVLDTSSYVKSVKRKRAQLTADGKLRWIDNPTTAWETLDVLMRSNCATVDAFVCQLLGDVSVH